MSRRKCANCEAVGGLHRCTECGAWFCFGRKAHDGGYFNCYGDHVFRCEGKGARKKQRRRRPCGGG